MSERDQLEKIDDVASDLEDVTNTVDEIAADPPKGVKDGTLKTLKRAVDNAIEAADKLENEAEE